MKKSQWKKRIHTFCVGLVVAFVITGCQGRKDSFIFQEEKVTESSSNREKTQEEFVSLTEEVFRNELKENTLNLHYTLAYPEDFGITEYEISFGDYRLESYEESYKELEKLFEQLETISVSDLEDEQKLTYQILKDYVKTELSTKDLTFYAEPLSPTLGVQAQLPVLMAEYTFRREQDITDYLALLGKLEETYTQILEFEGKKAEKGLFMPDYAVESVIAQCSQFIENPQESYLISTFDERIDAMTGLSESQRENYKKKNAAIVINHVTNAYQLLIDGLEQYKGTNKNENGLFYYPEGTQYYEYLVRTGTGSSDSVKKLQERTTEFISNRLYAMADLITKSPELINTISDYTLADGSPEEMLAKLSKEMLTDYPVPPDTIYTVKYVDESLKEYLSPAFYLTPPIDDAQENVIYINPLYADTNLYTTLAHEGYPGHLYQTVYTNQAGLPLIRAILSYKGYTEGWATYVEYDTYNRTAKDSAGQLLKLNDEISLALSAAIDMGIHYEGWTRQQVLSYLSDFGLGDENVVNELFERIVEEPSNYLSYFIGYLEILSLREQAEQTLGKNFSTIDFHDFLLTVGPAPFSVIQEELDRWLNETIKK